MSNPSDWNSNDDDVDDDGLELEDEVEGAFEQECDDEYEDEDEEPGEGEEERPVDAAATGGCFWTMMAAMAFWMVLAFAALGICVVFGGGW